MTVSTTAIIQGVLASTALLLMTGCGGGNSNSNPSSSIAATSSSISSATKVSSSSSSILSSSSSSVASSEPKKEHLVIAINVGSSDKVTYKGVEFQPDRFGTGGTPNSITGDIKGVDEDALFQSEKYGTQTYNVPVTNANYRVELHFAELYQTAAGKRLFNASVEGQTIFTNMDLFTLVGAKGAYNPPDVNVTVADKSLTIQLDTIADNATLSGFAIYSIDGEFVEPPPSEPIKLEPIKPGVVSSENAGADCVIPILPAIADLAVIAKLPDPFTKIDGNRITKKEDWRCRRQEILRQAENYIYGFKPPKPDSVTGTITNDKITVNVTHNGKSTSFSAGIKLPSKGVAPYPALVGFGTFGLAVDSTVVDSEGVAIITYDPYAVGAESGSTRTAKKGAFYDIYGSDSTTGLLAAWSWGVSRIIDVIEQANAGGSTLLDATHTGVTGCSRFGKGAFTVGVFDQRVALTMPVESGTGGVPAWRLLDGEGAQTASSAYGEQPWLGDAFAPFSTKATKLPIDTHEVIALVAPRGLFIMDNPHISNLGPIAANTAALAGLEVYKALGAESNITYNSNVANGNHCSIRPEFAEPLRQNLHKFMRGQTDATTGGITAAAKAQGDLSLWRSWTTPTLQ